MNAFLIAFSLLISGPVAAADKDDAPRVLPQGVIEIHVEDLHCKTCAKKLARKLYVTPGVKRVRTYVEKDLAVIELQPKKEVELARLWRAAELAEQKPVALLVLDKKLVAKDFAEEGDQKSASRVPQHTPR